MANSRTCDDCQIATFTACIPCPEPIALGAEIFDKGRYSEQQKNDDEEANQPHSPHHSG
jgi:hypothetical protein